MWLATRSAATWRFSSPRVGGRAATVVALAPAGGWAKGDEVYKELLRSQSTLHEQMKAIAPQAKAMLATPAGKRQATQLVTTNFEHIPVELLAHELLGAASCTAAESLIEHALREGWSLDAEKITCPVRIVWGTADRLLPWPHAAARYRNHWLPHADWVELDGIGHCPQLDIPVDCTADPRVHLALSEPRRRHCFAPVLIYRWTATAPRTPGVSEPDGWSSSIPSPVDSVRWRRSSKGCDSAESFARRVRGLVSAGRGLRSGPSRRRRRVRVCAWTYGWASRVDNGQGAMISQETGSRSKLATRQPEWLRCGSLRPSRLS